MGLLLKLHDVVNCAVADSPPCRSCSSELDQPVLVRTSMHASVLQKNSMSKQICCFQQLSHTTKIPWCSSHFSFPILDGTVVHPYESTDMLSQTKAKIITSQLMVPVLKIRAIVHERTWVHNFNNIPQKILLNLQ